MYLYILYTLDRGCAIFRMKLLAIYYECVARSSRAGAVISGTQFASRETARRWITRKRDCNVGVMNSAAEYGGPHLNLKTPWRYRKTRVGGFPQGWSESFAVERLSNKAEYSITNDRYSVRYFFFFIILQAEIEITRFLHYDDGKKMKLRFGIQIPDAVRSHHRFLLCQLVVCLARNYRDIPMKNTNAIGVCA